MMNALISLHSLEIIDETGFIEDHWETCKSAFPELERMDKEVYTLLGCEHSSEAAGAMI